METVQISLALALIAMLLIPSHCFEIDAGIGVPGTPIAEQPTYYSDQSENCRNNTGPICSNDCRSLFACVGDAEPEHVEVCEALNRGERYCVGKRCQAEPDHHNAECLKSQLRCTSEGVFPDPYDCTTYYSCYGLNSVPFRFKCPSNYVYSSRRKLCLRKLDYGTCDAVKCGEIYNYYMYNKFVPFIPNSAYYAFCGVPVVMFKCDDEENYKFDESLNDCVYHCKWSGYHVDPSDCSQFYICESAGARAILQKCPSNYKFNGVQCIDSDNCPYVYYPTTEQHTDPTPEYTTNAPTEAPQPTLIPSP